MPDLQNNAIADDEPLVSVIVCFLNPGPWLQEAVESVIAQTFTNWELILVDDGSVRSDSEIALTFANSSDGKITYMDHADHANIGLTRSRNVGIKASKGEFIAFLDADDYWYPDKLEKQLATFTKLPDIAIICEASRFWYSWADPQCNDPIITIGAPPGSYPPCRLNKLLYPLGPGQPPCPSGIMTRKEALTRNGGFEEAFSGMYQLYEDQAFLAKIYLKESIYIDDASHNKYRKHEHSMSGAAGNPEVYPKVRNFFLDWLGYYLDKQQLKDDEIQALLEAARLPAMPPAGE